MKKPRKFSAVVVSWRERRGLTRAGAARLLGIPIRTLENWEYGWRTPRGFARILLEKRFSK